MKIRALSARRGERGVTTLSASQPAKREEGSKVDAAQLHAAHSRGKSNRFHLPFLDDRKRVSANKRIVRLRAAAEETTAFVYPLCYHLDWRRTSARASGRLEKCQQLSDAAETNRAGNKFAANKQCHTNSARRPRRPGGRAGGGSNYSYVLRAGAGSGAALLQRARLLPSFIIYLNCDITFGVASRDWVMHTHSADAIFVIAQDGEADDFCLSLRVSPRFGTSRK